MDPRNHKHLQQGGLLSSIREVVFGLEDSLVSTLGVAIGIAAGAQDVRIVLLSGAVLVMVEALSMAAGSFLSSKSHREMLEQAIREEESEIEHFPEEERKELRDMYLARGFNEEETAILVRRITADKKLWLEEMMAKELKINAIDLEEPKKSAFVMFFAYIAGGMVTMTPYMFLPLTTASIVATVVTAASLFGIGYAKGRIMQNDGLKSGTEMLLVASLAAGLGYLIGNYLGAAFGINVR